MSYSKDRVVKFVRDPQLKHVELRFSHYRQHAFQKHTHETYSIGIVKQGRTTFFHHEQIERVGSEDVVLINPGEVHACNPQSGSILTYYMLYVDSELVQQVVSDLTGKAESDFYFSTPIVRDNNLYRGLNNLGLSMLRSGNKLEIESNIYETLSEIVLKYGAKDYHPATLNNAAEMVWKGYDYLLDNLSRNVSLQELSALSGLSPYHFLRAFRSQFGLPPHTWQLQQRINAARRLLAAGQPIAHVAAEVGFSDQSHFTRKFKAFVGATPRQYQLGER